MKRKRIGLPAVLMLAGGVLLSTASIGQAQRAGGGMGSSPQGQMGGGQPQSSMNNPGFANGPNGSGQQNDMQAGAERNFVGTMRRNIKAENELSKLALKNSSNDGVKKMAQQVISENHRESISLGNAASSANGPIFDEIPSQTKKALKDMKKLNGVDFDKMYLSQMDGYIKSDQKAAMDASTSLTSANLRASTMQLRTLADNRAQQLTQVAQGENFKIQ